MHVAPAFTSTLQECTSSFEAFSFHAEQIYTYNNQYGRRSILCQISIKELGTQLDMELYVSRQDMRLKLIRPFIGIESSASHIPYFANPLGRGYLNNAHDDFSERGVTTLLNSIKEVATVFKIVVFSESTFAKTIQ